MTSPTRHKNQASNSSAGKSKTTSIASCNLISNSTHKTLFVAQHIVNPNATNMTSGLTHRPDTF